MHAYIHTCMHTYIYTWIYTCMHTYIHTYIDTHTHTHTCIHIYIYIHTCIHVCAHTYAYLPTYQPVFVKIGQLVQSCWSHKTTSRSIRNIIRIKIKDGNEATIFDSSLKWFVLLEVLSEVPRHSSEFFRCLFIIPLIHCACWRRDINITGFLMQNCLLWNVHTAVNWSLSVWQFVNLLYE